MFRTFQTRLRGTEAQIETLNAYATLIGTAERGLYARLRAGRQWKGDLSRAYHRDVGLGSALTTMVYRQLRARLTSARSIAKRQRSNLKRRLWRECLRLQGKRDRLAKIRSAVTSSFRKLEVAGQKLQQQRQRLAAVASPSITSLQRLKRDIETVYHLRQRLRTDLRRRQALTRSIHDLKRSIQKIAARLKDAEKEHQDPTAIFGPRKLFRSQYSLRRPFVTHGDWLKAWRDRRDKSLFLEGDARAPSGNRYVRLSSGPRGQFDLELRLPKALASRADEHFVSKGRDIFVSRFQGLHFHHGHHLVQQALSSGAPMTFRFQRDQTSWVLSVTVSQDVSIDAPDWTRGALGVDWNTDKIVAAYVDSAGNLVRAFSFPCPTKGKTATQSRDIVRKVSARVALLARTLGVSVVKEELDFASIKASPRAMADSRYSNMLTGFAYASFDRAVTSACHRLGIALIPVDPFGTTTTGRLKFSRRYGLSADQAAALVIARRGMQFSERLIRKAPKQRALPADPWHPTVTREERKACVASAHQSMGDNRGAIRAGVVFAVEATTVYLDERGRWRGDVHPMTSRETSGCSRGDRLSRTSKGWRVCRRE